MRGGYRKGSGRPKGTKKDPTVIYYRRIKPEWVEILDEKLKELKGANQMTFKIQDREAGNIIESGLSLEEANKMLEKFENDDKIEGTYTPNFYEIVEEQ